VAPGRHKSQAVADEKTGTVLPDPVLKITKKKEEIRKNRECFGMSSSPSSVCSRLAGAGR
jgi:hypothetical protein